MSKIELSLAEIPFPDTSVIERQFLADCVGNPESMPEFTSIVDESMFTDEGRLYIWKTIVWMFNTGQVIDLATVSTRTGRYYIDEVLTRNVDASTPYTSVQHAVQLRAATVRRRAYHSAVNLIKSATQPDAGELDIFEAAQQLTLDIQGEKTIVAEADMKSILNSVDEEVKENKANTESGKRVRVPTGFETLDYLTYSGWGPGQLIVLAARPSVGKTAIMLQMAKAAAMNGFPATIFSLEMTKEELGKRFLFSTGRVRPKEVASGMVNEYGYAPAMDELKDLPIYINDESRTLAGILSRITISVMQQRCKIAFIDYLGLITIDETGRSPLYQQIAKATRELKLIAKRQGIPIVLLCQLNRDAAKEDGAPQLFHLRDSGSIEQDADIVIMLEQDRKLMESPNDNPNINMWLRKNRQFKKDVKVTVKPNESYSSFTEVHERPEAEPEEQSYDFEQEKEDF